MAKPLSENAQAIYKKLYLAEILGEKTPTEAHSRVARFAASAEKDPENRADLESRFFDLMENNLFRPNTPTFMNAGVRPNPQTSACFVGDLQDDMISILDFDRDAAIIYKSGSGIGGNYGMLREKNAPLSTGGVSSGPISYMRKVGMTAHAVKSGGASRRAAHMAMMTDTHPDLLEFINLKAQSDEFVILPSGERASLFSAMNLSVAISDEFMLCVEDGSDWDLIGVVDGEIKATYPARELFDLICQNAWRNGDPGIWFIDQANRDNTAPSLGRILSTNPCGEQPLLPRQACALGSINVAAFVLAPGAFDWTAFKKTVRLATHFLDNCIDLSGFPTPEYEKMAKLTRPIGLGIMGFADALILVGMRYGSAEAAEFGRQLSRTMTATAIETSAELAQEKGAFPAFEANRDATVDVVAKFVNDLDLLAKIKEHGVRNSQWTTIAPTGSTSISCDCSQGMEPLFAICYDKHLSDSEDVWTFVHPIFEKRFSDKPWYPEAIKAIAKNHGSIKGLDLPPEAYVFVCAHDIDWEERIQMQSALQKGISSAISSTINLPNSTSPGTIKEIYMTAWAAGLKGITVYRDGALASQPVKFGGKDSTPSNTGAETTPDSVSSTPGNAGPLPANGVGAAIMRQKVRYGYTHEIATGHGKIYLTVNCDEAGRPMEVFTNGGKNGSVNAANLEAMARLVSIALQSGVEPWRLARTIENINDGTVAWDRLVETDKRPVCIISVPDAMGKVLRRFYCDQKTEPQPTAVTIPPEPDTDNGKRCSDCNSPVYMHEGCEFCPNCGSKCG